MKRRLAVLILFLGVCLTACGTGGEELPSDGPVTLIYASFQPFGVDKEVQLAIEQFNETHAPDVQIEVRDYWGTSNEEAEQGRERLITEMTTGNVPDLLDLGYTNERVAMLPYRQMAQKGYLENLWPYIENDPELGRAGVWEAPLKAAEIDGGLYTVFDSVFVTTLVGAESVVGDRMSWTMADLRTAFAAMPEGSSIMQYGASKASVAKRLLGMRLDSYIDWEAGRCNFDCGNFRTDLEFLNELPEEYEFTSTEDYMWEIGERRLKGLQLVEWTSIYTPHDIQICDAYYGGRASFIGFPVEDGRAGSSFYPAFTKLSMSSTCKDKEAAWEIIRQILLPRYDGAGAVKRQQEDSGSLHIPVNRADYGMYKQAFMTKGLMNKNWILYPGRDASVMLEVHESTEEEMRRFEDAINSVERIELYDSALLNVVMETIGPYFAGDKTLEETVELVQNRVTLYVNENQ